MACQRHPRPIAPSVFSQATLPAKALKEPLHMSFAKLAQDVECCEHQLSTLEEALFQMEREGLYSPPQLNLRLRQLKKYALQLQAVKRQLPAAAKKKANDRGLWHVPPLYHRSAGEGALCLRFLEESAKLTQTLTKDSLELARLVKQCVYGSMLPFFSSFALAKIRKKLLKLEGKRDSLGQKRQYLSQWLETHFAELKLALPGASAPLQSLKQHFSELETLEQQLFHLQAECQQEELELHCLAQWLGLQEQRLLQRLPQTKPQAGLTTLGSERRKLYTR